MSIRKVNFTKGEYYHIYNRGNSKQAIFNDKDDYYHFMNLLFMCNDTENLRTFNLLREEKDFLNYKQKKAIISIGSYCLMPNHFHILITEIEEGGISKFMQKLSTAYVMYYNQKYERTGGLFEGKFKSIHMEDNIQIKYLFSYIHLNPIKLIQKDWKEKGINNKKEALEFLDQYKYSSYLDFIGIKRFHNHILNIKQFPKYFPTKVSFMKEIFEWLNFKELE
jgi:putative transposase